VPSRVVVRDRCSISQTAAEAIVNHRADEQLARTALHLFTIDIPAVDAIRSDSRHTDQIASGRGRCEKSATFQAFRAGTRIAQAILAFQASED
jgi:hypothetical protein